MEWHPNLRKVTLGERYKKYKSKGNHPQMWPMRCPRNISQRASHLSNVTYEVSKKYKSNENRLPTIWGEWDFLFHVYDHRIKEITS